MKIVKTLKFIGSATAAAVLWIAPMAEALARGVIGI